MTNIKAYVRRHETLMSFLSVIYNFIGLNRVKGRKGLGISCRGAFINKSKIINHGKNNKIIFNRGCRVYNSRIQFFGNNNSVIIDNDCVLKNVDVWIDGGAVIEVGHNTHFTGAIHIACVEGKKVHIGSRCLFSDQITLRTGDSHSILDKDGHRTNHAGDIWIGDHVWVGQQVVILKGVEIEHDSVIGTRALVTVNKFKPNVLIVGMPAKVVKENIFWDHRLV